MSSDVDADDVAEEIEEWLASEHDVEADVEGQIWVHAHPGDRDLHIAIRTDDTLRRDVLDGLRSRGFVAAAITKDDDPRAAFVRDLRGEEGGR